jgi:endo-1,4-beta-xylanase
MNIVWQLFGTQIVFLSIVILLMFLWIICPRRYKNSRRRILQLNGIIILLGLICALYTYWPKTYEKQYLSSVLSKEIEVTPLRALADSLDFYIGMATSSESPYLDKIATEFNSIVAENEFKPNELIVDPINWEFDFSKADRLINYAQSKNIRVRGHTLIWGKFPGRTYPADWKVMVNEADIHSLAMKEIMERYINVVMGHFKGKVSSWDVVNEPMGGALLYPNVFSKSLGEKYIDFAFHTAYKVDPDCKLYLNEAIVDYNGPSGKAFLSLLQRLIDRGVPIHGVGLQTHNLFKLHNTEDLKQYIDRIEMMGLEVEITELDIRLLLFKKEDDPYDAQGRQYRKIVEICTLSPACKGVTLWGMSDKNNWMDAVPPFSWKSPNAPNIYDEEMNRKPAYFGIWQTLKTGNSPLYEKIGK